MASWSGKRRVKYIVGGLCIIAGLVSIPIVSILTKKPTCFDKAQNQDEEGVDCGGSCVAICQAGAKDLVVDWARPFRVEEGTYDMGALIENTNEKAGTKEAVYHFKMYDADNLLIAERFGKTFVLPGGRWVIFEGNIKTGERAPRHAFIEFSPDISWIRTDLLNLKAPDIGTINQVFSEVDGKPRLSTTLVNKSPSPVEHIEVIAVLSDAEGTAIGVSRTIVEKLEKYGTTDVVFTWREPFPVQPVKIDVIPRINYIASVGAQ
ncbi:MAG: hypothetical protein HGA67_04545 [Candidatus Yonathbacteria bacterium]|nr:hypothetical protein [Candidatus Yonathbacteria bacterium]